MRQSDRELLRPCALSRRKFLTGAGAVLTAAALPMHAIAAPRLEVLTAAPGKQALAGTPGGDLDVKTWSYGGSVPGPLLRYRRGDRLRVRLDNQLEEPTSIHWHGLRLPAAMDGAAPLTQQPVAPGEAFDYAFDLNDAGTYWYHTHFRGWNQQDRGLYGIVIVDEGTPPAVDRDLLLVLDDWVIAPDGKADTQSLGDLHEWAHAGRLGNFVTINSEASPSIAVTRGERLRLRLANVANSQIFALFFDGHDPWVIAEDGNPVAPRQMGEAPLLLGPGQRADLVFDATAGPRTRHALRAFTLADEIEIEIGTITYGDGEGGSGLAGTDISPLEPNDRPTLDFGNARRVRLNMEGGAMGRMSRAMLGGRMMGFRELASNRRVWAFNGVAGDLDAPLATLKRGETAVVEIVNDTSFPHAMHLHGTHFREVARDGKPLDDAPWRDTTVMGSGERVDIAFVAETPGKWMLHCHMIEHQAGGMMTFIEIKGDAA